MDGWMDAAVIPLTTVNHIKFSRANLGVSALSRLLSQFFSCPKALKRPEEL